uniref:Uncharacterized protein n=1 Tax=Sphaerodactylus townsendi TaxID=933632 RepID=A0ACB8FGS2_9SAUR
MQKERLYKLLVIGDLGVGKTSIIKRYVHQNFVFHYRATIGVDFALKVLPWDPETVVRLQLWDIAGEEGVAAPRERDGAWWWGTIGDYRHEVEQKQWQNRIKQTKSMYRVLVIGATTKSTGDEFSLTTENHRVKR